MKFNLDTIPHNDRTALLVCCEGFVEQDNPIFADLHRALSIGGECEIAVPVGAEPEDLLQGVMFFSKIVDQYTGKREGESAPSLEFCRLVLESLTMALQLKRRREAALN